MVQGQNEYVGWRQVSATAAWMPSRIVYLAQLQVRAAEPTGMPVQQTPADAAQVVIHDTLQDCDAKAEAWQQPWHSCVQRKICAMRGEVQQMDMQPPRALGTEGTLPQQGRTRPHCRTSTLPCEGLQRPRLIQSSSLALQGSSCDRR